MGLELIENRLRDLNITIPSDIFEDMSETKNSISTAVDILNDLLDYEKLESGLMTLDKSPADPIAFLQETARPFLLGAANKGVRLKILSGPRAAEERAIIGGRVVVIDEKKISQVLRNFLSNAIKFTPHGGDIEVKIEIVMEDLLSAVNTKLQRGRSIFPLHAARVEPYEELEDTVFVRFRVIDSGFGISPENQSKVRIAWILRYFRSLCILKVFREIVQFEAKAQQGGGGSGIGLWISKKIVELHGGRVGLVSEGKGKGCEFFFDLELKPRPADMPPTSQISSVDRTQSTVVVHDLAARHELMKLEERRSQIIQCLSGDAAIPERASRSSSSGAVVFEQLRILVVDDSAPTRKMAIRLLSGCNCRCFEAADGDEAVEKVRLSQDGEYDVVLME